MKGLARLGLLILLLVALGHAQELNVTRVEHVVVFIDGKETSFTRTFAINLSELRELETLRSNLSQQVARLQDLLSSYTELANNLSEQVEALRSKLAQLSHEYDYLVRRKNETERAFEELRAKQQELRNLRTGSVVLSKPSAALVGVSFVLLGLLAHSLRRRRATT